MSLIVTTVSVTIKISPGYRVLHSSAGFHEAVNVHYDTQHNVIRHCDNQHNNEENSTFSTIAEHCYAERH